VLHIGNMSGNSGIYLYFFHGVFVRFPLFKDMKKSRTHFDLKVNSLLRN
jgi:hypothetical protein